MDKQLIKAKKNHLKSLMEFYAHLLDQGHTFWACSGKDTDTERPFFYVQTNRVEHMMTCTTCQTLIEKKREIIKLQKELKLKPWPLRYNLKGHEYTKIKRMSVSSSSNYNINYAYL